MRLQHEEVLRRQETKQIAQAQKPDDDLERVSASSEPKKASKLYAIISVASGKGIAKIFRSLGVQIIIEGGQTMNPSTEQFMHAIEEADAERVIILPNNKNIVMAAQQAADLAGVQVAVIPSTSIPQGMSSLLAFSADEQLETNRERMSEALGYVKTGLVTYAVRDTTLNEIVIKEGDFIGIFDSNIVVSGRDPYETALRLITEMVGEEDELITLIYGTDVKGEDMKELEKRLASLYDAYEVEVHDGGQSLYPFIIAVE